MISKSYVLSVVRTLLIASVLLVPLGTTSSHDHNLYDPDCCGLNDCEPVSKFDEVNGKTFVTNQYGTRAITGATKIRDSKDNRTHACIVPWIQDYALCLYVAPSN